MEMKETVKQNTYSFAAMSHSLLLSTTMLPHAQLTLLTNCATSTFTSPGTYLATSLGFSPGSTQHTECKSVVTKLYKVFTEKECTLVEINPLVETKQGKVQSVISHRIVYPTAHYCLRLRTWWYPLHQLSMRSNVASWPSLLSISCLCFALTLLGHGVRCEAWLRWQCWIPPKWVKSISPLSSSCPFSTHSLCHSLCTSYLPSNSSHLTHLSRTHHTYPDPSLIAGATFMHRDRTQEDPREVEAAKYDLNYIGLTGTYCTVLYVCTAYHCFHN